MARRYSITEKWREDKWFKHLTAIGKLLYFYLYDNSNIAGIWQVDIEQAAHDMKINEEIAWQAFKELEDSYVTNADYIMLIDFIRDQRNFGFDPNNPAHRGMGEKLAEHKDLYEQAWQKWKQRGYIENLLFEEEKDPTKTLQRVLGKGKGKGKGKKRTVEQKPKLYPMKGKKCSVPGCVMPAIYKDSSGSYDHLYCGEHMPAKVKKAYDYPTDT